MTISCGFPQRIGRSTGGIGRRAGTSTVMGDQRATAWLTLRGKGAARPERRIAGDPAWISFKRARLDDGERFEQLCWKREGGT